MGATTTKKANSSPKTKTITRKATFLVVGEGKDRVFTPVNKRGHTVARKAGKRTRVTVADLKALKGTGSYRYYAYVNGALKAIRV